MAREHLEQQLEERTGELQEALRQQSATSQILRAMADSPTDLRPVLDSVAENAARLCGANDALIFLVDNGHLRHFARYGSIIPAQPRGGLGPPINRGSVPGRAIMDKKTVQVEDLRAVVEDFPEARTRGIVRGLRTLLATPLLRQDEPIGVILIRRQEICPFTEKQIALLRTFADQAVIAIENVRLFQEIQEKNRQIEEANARLKELDRLKSDFVSNVSHELRTPLTAITGAVDLVLRAVAGPLTEKQAHYLTRVRSNTQHLAGLINDLLDLSRIESGRMEVRSGRVSLDGLVHEVAETLRPVAAEKVVALEVTLPEPSILVWADRAKINQVLMNVIGNAIKFTPPEGRVEVSVSRNGNESVQVCVSDTGPGVAPEERERIFEKFYQIADPGGTKPKGTGLGLAICKTLVELHGGQIWVESEMNRGSKFVFTLRDSDPQSLRSSGQKAVDVL